VGIAVADVTGGWIAQVDGDSFYPQQSVSKLWTAITILDLVDHGRLQLAQAVMMTPQDRSVFNLPDTREITDQGYQTTVGELLARAISASDNTAFDRLIQLAGGPGAVAAEMRAKGVGGIRVAGPEREVQSRLAGLGAWKAAYGVGTAFKDARAKLSDRTREAAMHRYVGNPPDGATPVGLVKGLVALDRFRLLSPQSTELLIGLMRQAKTGPMRLKGGLPAGWSIAHKTGTGQDWQGGSVGINDVGLITAPDGHTYAVAVMMRRTLHPVPERLTFMQGVARAVVDQWQAQTGVPASVVAAPSPQAGAQPGA
jgi:beta-lactamase class A